MGILTPSKKVNVENLIRVHEAMKNFEKAVRDHMAYIESWKNRSEARSEEGDIKTPPMDIASDLYLDLKKHLRIPLRNFKSGKIHTQLKALEALSGKLMNYELLSPFTTHTFQQEVELVKKLLEICTVVQKELQVLLNESSKAT